MEFISKFKYRKDDYINEITFTILEFLLEHVF